MIWNGSASVTNKFAVSYDSLGQLTNGVRRWSDDMPVEGEQFSYTFDDIGNRKSTREGGNWQGANLRSATYSINTLNQVTSRGVPNKVDVIGMSTATNAVTVNGNSPYRKGSFFHHELSVTNASGPAWTPVTIVADTTKTGNILTPPSTQNISYDADGNMTNNAVWRYIWDGENRLVEMQPLTNNPAASKKWLKFVHDWRGRRIQKSVAAWNTNSSSWSVTLSNRFLYSGWNLIGELNATNNAIIRGYIWGNDLSGTLQNAGGVGGLVVVNDANNGVHFPAYDESGNVVGLVKSDGTVSAQYEYDPFGQVIRATGSMALANPFRFSTKYLDDETGMICYPRRYYIPSLGTWGNRDPIEEWGGLNVYGFCYNDPTDYIDPRGLSIWSGISGLWNWWFNPPFTGPNYLTPDGRLRNGPPPAPIADLGDDMSVNDLPSMRTGRADQVRSGADDALNFQDQLAREGVNAGLGAAIPGEKAGEMVEGAFAKFLSKCVTKKAPKSVLPELRISASKYPELAENILNAQKAGHPDVLTHGGEAVINANRNAALHQPYRDFVPNIGNGLSRDEYPFASSLQGGGGSWVGHIPVSQQQAQGGLIRAMNLKPGDKYRVVIVP